MQKYKLPDGKESDFAALDVGSISSSAKNALIREFPTAHWIAWLTIIAKIAKGNLNFYYKLIKFMHTKYLNKAKNMLKF